jgi:hypothetical protein
MVDITVGAIPPVQNNSQKGKDPRRQASKKKDGQGSSQKQAGSASKRSNGRGGDPFKRGQPVHEVPGTPQQARSSKGDALAPGSKGHILIFHYSQPHLTA